MKNLLEMIALARTQGIVTLEKSGVRNLSPAEMNAFFDLAKECQPFVFARKNIIPTHIQVAEDETLDAPFRVFHIECDDGDLTVGFNPDHNGNGQPISHVNISSVLVEEVKPNEFIYYCVAYYGQEFGKRLVKFSGEHAKGIDPIAIAFMSRLKKESWGHEKIRERTKIGTGASKQTITYRGVIHICPDKQAERYQESIKTRKVDWNASWKVRGHWRRFEGLGKNRLGQYCVTGMTWVSDYVKGNKELEPMARVRAVHAGNNLESHSQ